MRFDAIPLRCCCCGIDPKNYPNNPAVRLVKIRDYPPKYQCVRCIGDAAACLAAQFTTTKQSVEGGVSLMPLTGVQS
jgi:hypothetical protein